MSLKTILKIVSFQCNMGYSQPLIILVYPSVPLTISYGPVVAALQDKTCIIKWVFKVGETRQTNLIKI